MFRTMIACLILLFIAAFTVLGVVFVKDGYKVNKEGKRNITLMTLGWIFLGILSLGMTLLTFYVMVVYNSFVLVILLLLSPIIVIAGLVLSLAFGINGLVNGYRLKDKSKITRGYVGVAIFTIIVISLTILVFWFSNYLQAHPIALM